MQSTFRNSAAICGLLAVLAAPAMAQENTGSAPAARVDLGDIVVTAERRESTVREVPFSIAAFGGTALRTQQIFSPSDLTRNLPGITIETTDKSLSILSIRGNVSTFRTATLDSPVAYFVDDVYYIYNNDVNSNFYDINRVEVLRGPQGTLFGRNVVGGAIVVATNDPAFETDYFLQGSVGNGGYVRTEGMVNGTLVDDKVAARFAFSTESSDGLIDAPNQASNYGKTDGYAMRGKILFRPTETLEVILAADYSYTKGNGGAIGLGIGGEQFVPATFGDFRNERWFNNDYAESPYRQRLRGGYLRADLELLGGTLTSITGFRMNDSFAINDDIPVATIVSVFDRRQSLRERSFTQEVRYASAADQRVSYIVGAYFLTAKVSTDNIFYYSPLPGSGVPASIRRNPDVTNIHRVQDGRIRSLAVFGEATLHITDRVAFVAGGRFTSDRKRIDYHAYSETDPGAIPGFGFPGEVFASGGKTWNAFTPRLTLKAEPVDNVNLYATWAKGFKSGGFVDNAYLNPTLPLDPEKATNYEIGAKARLFDGMLDINVDLFKQKTKDLQNFSGQGGIAHTYNGTLDMKGWELESTIRPVAGFNIGFNYTHLIGRYSSLFDPMVNLDFSGNPAKYSPRDSFMISAAYDIGLPGGARLTPQADFSYSTRISTEDSNTLRLYPNLADATRGRTLNARLTYESADGRWSVGLWGKNLTNHYQIVQADDITSFLVSTTGGNFLAPSGGATTYWKIFSNQPRSYGITVSLQH